MIRSKANQIWELIDVVNTKKWEDKPRINVHSGMIHPIQRKLHTKLLRKRHLALLKSQNVQILVYPLRGTSN